MNKFITLEHFFDNDYPDGYYAIWKTGKSIHPENDSFLFGFSGAVVEYNRNEGFKDYPEWVDNTKECDINIVLLSEIPSVDDLISGEF